MTFGGSSGRFNFKAGSLGVGWSVSLPLAPRSSTKALMAENSVVYAAGAGPLCNMVTVDTKVTDAQDLGLCIESVVEGLDATSVSGAESQVRYILKSNLISNSFGLVPDIIRRRSEERLFFHSCNSSACRLRQ